MSPPPPEEGARTRAPLFDGEGLVTRCLRVPRDQVAWVRYVLEAHDGLANLHGAGDGTVTLVAPSSRAEELDAVLEELVTELGLT